MLQNSHCLNQNGTIECINLRLPPGALEIEIQTLKGRISSCTESDLPAYAEV